MKLNQEDLNICVALLSTGDYNSVLCRDEVTNSNSFSFNRNAGFSNWIFREELIHLGFKGPRYTWCRGTKQGTFRVARLDRAVCNVDWKIMFPETKVTHLPMVNSDHSPLLITTNPNIVSEGNKNFKFSAAWLTHPDFLKVVEENWRKEQDVEVNRRNLAQKLGEWNKNCFGNIFHRKRRVIARIQ